MSRTHLTSITKRFTDLLKSGDEELNAVPPLTLDGAKIDPRSMDRLRRYIQLDRGKRRICYCNGTSGYVAEVRVSNTPRGGRRGCRGRDYRKGKNVTKNELINSQLLNGSFMTPYHNKQKSSDDAATVTRAATVSDTYKFEKQLHRQADHISPN
jgi:hypothetical protein